MTDTFLTTHPLQLAKVKYNISYLIFNVSTVVYQCYMRIRIGVPSLRLYQVINLAVKGGILTVAYILWVTTDTSPSMAQVA